MTNLYTQGHNDRIIDNFVTFSNNLDVTHVLVDEVHERDLHTDFLLIILKDLLIKRPHLKLVLMSATLQTKLFSQYFGGCPCLHISGELFCLMLCLENSGSCSLVYI